MEEIYLYSEFYRYSAESFARDLDKSKGKEVKVNLYSSGGSPAAGYTILSKMQKHGNVSLSVDGFADSMAAFMLCYAKNVECLEITTSTFHRAAYPSWVDVDQTMLEELDRINAFLRKGLESRVSSEKFEAVTGYTIDQLFSMDGRIDVTVNAEQLKELGLVDKINKVTEEMIGAINGRLEMAASTSYTKLNPIATTKPEEKVNNSKSNSMTVEKLRSEHPEVYQAAVALGIKQEKDRAGAWLAFVDVDAEAVAKGIKGDENLSQTAMAEFSRKALSAESLKKLGEDSPKGIATDEQEGQMTAEQKKEAEIQAHTDKVLADLGISKK